MVNVMDRMGLALTGKPYCMELTVVLIDDMLTWLIGFVLSMRNSRRRLSSSRKERKNEAFRVNCGIPGIVSRPASPKVPVAGMMNAAGLKKPEPVVTGRPVAWARALPVQPVPDV